MTAWKPKKSTWLSGGSHAKALYKVDVMPADIVEKIILASTSPFRQELMRQLEIPFTVVAPEVDEKSITAGKPEELAILRSAAKAQAGAYRVTNSIVIASDQVLGFNGKPYDKVEDPEKAAKRLRSFAGHTHNLYSAVTMLYRADAQSRPNVLADFVVQTSLSMRPLSEEEVDAYIELGEWQGTVGCYKIEGKGLGLFSHIQGESSAIIGLPMPELITALSSLGYRPLVDRLPFQLKIH